MCTGTRGKDLYLFDYSAFKGTVSRLNSREDVGRERSLQLVLVSPCPCFDICTPNTPPPFPAFRHARPTGLPCSCRVARVVRLAVPCGSARTWGSTDQISTHLYKLFVLRPSLSLSTLAIDHSPGPHPARAFSGTETLDIFFFRNVWACGSLAPCSSMSRVWRAHPEYPRRL